MPVGIVSGAVGNWKRKGPGRKIPFCQTETQRKPHKEVTFQFVLKGHVYLSQGLHQIVPISMQKSIADSSVKVEWLDIYFDGV